MLSLLDAGQTNWSEALNDFLRGCRTALKPNSARFYGERLSLLVRWCESQEPSLPLSRFKPLHMRQYMEERALKGFPTPGRLAGPKTRKHDRSCAKVFFQFCIDQDYYPGENPILKVQTVRVPKPALRMPRADELQELLNQVMKRWDVRTNDKCKYTPEKAREFYSARDMAIFTGLIETGARIGELLALTFDDFQPDHVEHDVSGRRRPAPRILIQESKGNEPRVVPIGRKWIQHVRVWLDKRKQMIKWWNASDHLFTDKRGNPLNARSFGKHFRVYRAFAEQKGYRLHDFRHFTARILANENVEAAASILGHKNLNYTRAYLETDPENNRKVAVNADVLGRVLRAQSR